MRSAATSCRAWFTPTRARARARDRPIFDERARFYAISAEGRLNFSRNIARYIVFLAENTGLAPAAVCAAAIRRLDTYLDVGQMLADI